MTPRLLYAPKTFAVRGPRCTAELPERQWELLSLLFEHRGAYLTRETIISRIWGPYYVSQTRLFNEALAALRRAMRDAGYPADMIREQRDLGIGIPGRDLESEMMRVSASDGEAR